jgi:signal transduction histidine kinase
VTRRIVPALLAFIAVVMVASVIPLALRATSHDRGAYVAVTTATARSVAAAAEEKIADGLPGAGLPGALAEATREGDQVSITRGAGHLPEGTTVSGGQVRVVVAIRDGGQTTGPVLGTVVLTRPLAALERSIASLWLSLGLICGLALIAAALLAVGFARWVSRPLGSLDIAARRLADGDLTARVPSGSGPPEVRRVAATFSMMAGRLDTLIHGHRAMLADVSHQLRTPLAALRLRVDLVAADAKDGKPGVAEELAGVQEEIGRLSGLLDGLLAVARAESVVERRVVADVGAVAAERVAAWQPVASEQGVRLSGPSPAAAATVPLGDGHLEQILDNLLANAIDALDAGGAVRVDVRASGGSVLLTVADDGPGMSEGERARAFLRFSSARPGGTGLGLAIVHRLVTSDGGTARLSQTQGGGLTVAIEYPVLPGERHADTRLPREPRVTWRTPWRGTHGRR